MSWDYSKKEKCDSIIWKWQMYFQASNYRGRNFLNLNDDDGEPIQPSYSKGGAWLKCFSLSNSLCAWVTRLIANYVPIGKYKKRFFPNEPTSCPCGQAPLKIWDHILYDCKQYRQSWKPKRDSLKDMIRFLDHNPRRHYIVLAVLSLSYIVLHLLFSSLLYLPLFLSHNLSS